LKGIDRKEICSHDECNPPVKLTQKAPVMSQIPTQLTQKQFKQHFDPYLSQAKRGFAGQILRYELFNYILYWLHTGCQWAQIPIAPQPGSEKKKSVIVQSTATFRSGARMAV
jgi:hypothetical protein